jgi:hypothetical protein
LLNPVVALTITDFEMFPEMDQIISRFVLMEKSKLVTYPEGDVELVFVELTKFKRTLEELETATDEWLFFVDRAAELNAVPPKLRKVPEIEDAFERAEAAKLSPEEDHALEQKSRWVADQRMILAGRLLAEERLKEAESKAAQAVKEAESKAQEALKEAEIRAQQSVKEAESKAEQAAKEASEIQQRAVDALLAAGLSLEAARRSLGLE